MVGLLLVAIAALASLHGLIATYVGVILASLGCVLLTVRITTLNNTLRIAKELAMFREFMYAALMFSRATGAFEFGMLLLSLTYMILLTLVPEMALLNKF